MRGQILLRALKILKESALSQADFFEAILRSGYGARSRKIDYEYRKIQRARENIREKKERRKRLQNFLYQMKHDGLIEESNDGLTISDLGIQKIEVLKNKMPNRHYKSKTTKQMIIISFDIPEKLRRKRNWLREVVKNLGFQIIHQSVWMGKKNVPSEFIEDLEKLKILEFVEIFKVTKSGSLKKVV